MRASLSGRSLSAIATNCASKDWAPFRTSLAPTPRRSIENQTAPTTPKTRACTWRPTRLLALTRKRETPTSHDLLSRALFQPYRDRRVPPVGLGKVVAGADKKSRCRSDRPDRNAKEA